MVIPYAFILIGTFTTLLGTNAQAQDAAKLDSTYKSDIQPLLKKHCYDCHSGDTLEAEIDLGAATNLEPNRKHSNEVGITYQNC